MYVGLAVRRRPARLDAAALVDRHVDDHAAGLHQLQVVAFDQPRRLGAGDQHGADHQVGPRKLLADGVAVAEQAVDVGRHDVVEVAQPVHVDVENRDVGVEAGGDLGRVGADDAAAEDRDVRRRHARHAAQQNAAAHLRPFEVLGPFLDAHAAGHFAHRREQRQAALVVGERLVGDGRGAAGEHRLGQLAVGGEVEVGEDRLPAADQRPLGGQRLLDLHDQVGLGEDLRRRRRPSRRRPRRTRRRQCRSRARRRARPARGGRGAVSSSTPTGSMATRYSSSLISLGTPMIMAGGPLSVGRCPLLIESRDAPSGRERWLAFGDRSPSVP